MKLRKFGQVALASVVSLGLALGITACSTSTVIDYVYISTSKANLIYAYSVDSDTGAMTPLNTTGFSAGGKNPVSVVTSPNGKYLYAVNHDDSTVVQFTVADSGSLTLVKTYTTPGTLPTSAAINAAGTFLYVTDTYQPGATSGKGALIVYPVGSDGSLGTPLANGSLSYFAVGNSPSGVNVLAAGSAAYVINKSDSNISVFSIGSAGAPTQIATTSAGVTPSAITSDPTSRFVYVTDSAANQLIGYIVQSNGGLVPMVNGPFHTDAYPDGVTVDPRGYYLYVTNYNARTIGAYAIDQALGNPTQVAGTSSQTGPGPTCVIIDPSIGRYVYTSNFLDNTISGYKLDPHTGAIAGVQNSPFPTGGQPTCAAAVAHGNHATQNVQG